MGDGTKADAISQANTPVFDRLMSEYPTTALKTFGEFVGLPAGQMGNSEVGHLNIGAGRIVYQDLARINLAMDQGELAKNEVFRTAVGESISKDVALHFIGLVGHGGVHASQHHLHALVAAAEKQGAKHIFIHAFTDGRDTDPKRAVEDLSELTQFLKSTNAQLVSVIGRYYAMDRDRRWERIKVAYDLLTAGIGKETDDFIKTCGSSYDHGVTDEFIDPAVIAGKAGRIKDGDVVVCFNFRTDRCRQITTALTQTDLVDFGMKKLDLHYTTMTRYDERFEHVHVMFEKDNLPNTLGEVVAHHGGTQLRIAETEKYPHVTFFFSGGREREFLGETRIMLNSPKVATYDLKPEMSAREVAAKAIEAMNNSTPDFVCLNFANPDMVGHTGVFPAIVKAVETTDYCLGLVVDAARKAGYSLLVIADHGNADKAINDDGTPNTAHTKNLVPCILVSTQKLSLKPGILADVAPTILALMQLPSPSEMTGGSLIQ